MNMKTDKIKLFVPKEFQATKGAFDRYDIIGPSAFDVIEANNTVLKDVRGLALSGQLQIGQKQMALMPNLEIIAKFGVGYDTVDIIAASAANVVVTNTPDVLTDEVADLALGLLIATVRKIPQADKFLRDEKWMSGAFPLSASLRNKKIGILGLGRIGLAVAKRVEAMGLEVAYCNRSKSAEVPYDYFSDAQSLATACDVLIVVVPGGASTNGIVNRAVIEALGSDGVLINVARGSAVDEEALISALHDGRLGSAGLDVYMDEPCFPQTLTKLSNVVLLPHVGSATTTTRIAMGDLVFANLDNWFGGKGALTPVNLKELNWR